MTAQRPSKSSLPLEIGDAFTILAAVPDPLLVIGAARQIDYVNPAAEHFFRAGAGHLIGQDIGTIAPTDGPLLGLIDKALSNGSSVAEHDAEFYTPRVGRREVSFQLTPLPDRGGSILLTIRELTMASRMGHQLSHRDAARSVTGMAAVLAHEVKNPLAGIRGAAQLLETNASTEDQELTRLIRDETDRICGLIDSMERFSDPRPPAHHPVNVHLVLDHARRVAQTGFAAGVVFEERYDPSLPPVLGNRDQLVQVMLNLIKNAVEACEGSTCEILLSTAYRHGLRLAVPGTREQVHLPLEVAIQDNGPGIAADIRRHMFDPFVTTKRSGTGLGLSLVAKIIGDHSGLIECDSEPGRTVFRLRLPIAANDERDQS
jgi:two-component system, NtrC family, nitrogen regulation sensor histidine kinase GlnL